MRTLLVTTTALLVLAGCGGSRPADVADAPAAEPTLGDVVAGKVLCEVGALRLGDDGVLTVSFWCDQSAQYSPGGEVVMVDAADEPIAVAIVHKIDAENGAMSVKIGENDLLAELEQGSPFRIYLP